LINLIESFRHDVSQKEAGPPDDLQAVKVQVKRVAAKAIMINSFIFIGLYKTKIAIEYRILEILLMVMYDAGIRQTFHLEVQATFRYVPP